MYGVSDTSREAETIKRIYDAQNSKIREYFKNRGGDFIEMNVTTGDGWLLLVTFLAGHYPLHFPHANRGNSKTAAKE